MNASLTRRWFVVTVAEVAIAFFASCSPVVVDLILFASTLFLLLLSMRSSVSRVVIILLKSINLQLLYIIKKRLFCASVRARGRATESCEIRNVKSDNRGTVVGDCVPYPSMPRPSSPKTFFLFDFDVVADRFTLCCFFFSFFSRLLLCSWCFLLFCRSPFLFAWLLFLLFSLSVILLDACAQLCVCLPRRDMITEQRRSRLHRRPKMRTLLCVSCTISCSCRSFVSFFFRFACNRK